MKAKSVTGCHNCTDYGMAACSNILALLRKRAVVRLGDANVFQWDVRLFWNSFSVDVCPVEIVEVICLA